MISDEHITRILNLHNIDVPGIGQSKSMHRLAKLWLSLLPTELQLNADEAFFQKVSSSDITASFDSNGEPRDIVACWLMVFVSPIVIEGIYRIRNEIQTAEIDDETHHFTLDRLREERAAALKPFEAARLTLEKLREAAMHSALPRDFYVCRSIGFSERVTAAAAIANFSRGQIPHTRRAPIIESMDNPLNDGEKITTATNDIAIVASIIDWYEHDLRYLAKRGKQSFEHWAIRKIWSNINVAFSPVGGTAQIVRPWAMVRDLLSLCDVRIDTEVIRKTLRS